MSLSKFNSRTDIITNIFDKYKYGMQRVAYRILHDYQYAEDVVSESMIKIIKKEYFCIYC